MLINIDFHFNFNSLDIVDVANHIIVLECGTQQLWQIN